MDEGWWDPGHHTWNEVRAYLQARPDFQGGPDLNRGLALTLPMASYGAIGHMS